MTKGIRPANHWVHVRPVLYSLETCGKLLVKNCCSRCHALLDQCWHSHTRPTINNHERV